MALKEHQLALREREAKISLEYFTALDNTGALGTTTLDNTALEHRETDIQALEYFTAKDNTGALGTVIPDNTGKLERGNTRQHWIYWSDNAGMLSNTGYWNIGILEYWITLEYYTRTLDNTETVTLKHWNTGTLDNTGKLGTGTLGNWNAGILEY
ncbi:hypothetical protein Glove_57g37 [Diversispora epigaea]|uniref:Uncharacterized protein n=1 Tax=Diversispora epigaea TaxID=1348612 RepID=A0A397JGT9_9GLOM|nr:hypothetical protein Glove_57g37 [Diversispora epigaea]